MIKDMSAITPEYMKHRLEELLANDRKIIEENYREIERLHSIIKEVREYIENYNIGMPYDHFVKKENLLEILDKENR